MKTSGWRFLVAAFALLAACTAVITFPLQAQTFCGSVIGTVNDAPGAVIPGATVTLTSLGTSEDRTAETEAESSYRFVNLMC